MNSPSTSSAQNPKRAVPVLLFLFVFSLIIDNGFKFTSKPIADDLGIDVTTVSLQATLAGVLIGIGAVVYATLADSIDIRKLLIAAIIMICAGSLLGYAFQRSFPMILTGRIVQTAGLAAAETLYVIYVTKYLPDRDQKTYLGLSTSAFQVSLLFGTLASGFIATYIGWTNLFLVPLIVLLTLPSVVRTIPKHESASSHLDVLGLVLIGVFSTGTLLYMQAFVWWWLLIGVVGLAGFVWHVFAHGNALISPAFFANRRYMAMLAVVLVIYSAQLGYGFMFPFLMSGIHGYEMSEISLLLVPAYVCAAVVGAASGAIGRVLSSRAAITLALGLIALSLVIPAAFMTGAVWPLVTSMVIFSAAYALMYAPLLNTALGDIPAKNSGIAVGFYNLVINIAVPLGIALSAKLIDAQPHLLDAFTSAPTQTAAAYANIMFILAGISVLALVLYSVAIAILDRKRVSQGS